MKFDETGSPAQAGRPTRLALFVATCAYAGYFPVAPGTVGSAVGILVDRLLRTSLPEWGQAGVVLLLALAGTAAAQAVEEALRSKDPSCVVVDELVGMLLSLAFLPLSLTGLVVGFLVFRLLDVVKPFPCRRAEALPGGWGIMLDDCLAGLYTNTLLRVASLWWPALLQVP